MAAESPHPEGSFAFFRGGLVADSGTKPNDTITHPLQNLHSKK
ncbi:MAG: hypothetical protein ABI763_14950 [Bacteroidota bacterium]